MLRLSRLSDYAVITLHALQSQGDTPAPASLISKQTHLPEPTIAKILKMLATSNLVTSSRGVKGGYILAKPLKDISIKSVINALDGPIALTACVDSSTDECEFAPKCSMRGRWEHVNQAIKSALDAVSIADMIDTPPQKSREKESA